MFATMQDVTEDRQAVTGDFVTIDFTGTLDGEALAELKSENFLLELGSKRFIPGFEDQLAGMRNGETKEIHLTFPADYSEKKMQIQFFLANWESFLSYQLKYQSYLHMEQLNLHEF